MSDMKLIHDLLKEVRDDVKEIKTEQVKQGVNIDINTKDLTEHKLGVQQCQKRLDILEIPLVIKYCTKKNISWTLGTIAVISGIILSFEKLGLINIF